MTLTSQSRFVRLRAALLALMLALGWMSVTVALAARSSDVCSMECCIEQGHCCCNPAHPYVEGQAPDGRETISDGASSQRCPDECATTKLSSQIFLRDADRAAPRVIVGSDSPQREPQRLLIARNSIWRKPSPPRAPPVS